MLASTTIKNGSGIPLVFLHGFLGNSSDWGKVCSYLPSCHCIGFDLPGHGNSPFVETFDIPINRFHLIGYSMGGRLAMRIKKEKIASLTLLSVHPGLKSEEEKQKRLMSDTKWAHLLLELPIDEFLSQWYDQPLFKSFRPDFSMRNKQNKNDLAKALIHYSLAKQSHFKMNDVLVGARDEKFCALHTNPLIIPDSGHQIHLENPRAVAEVIQKRIGL